MSGAFLSGVFCPVTPLRSYYDNLVITMLKNILAPPPRCYSTHLSLKNRDKERNKVWGIDGKFYKNAVF